ncbi:MAG TPA: hypothetical protein VF813_12050, partial [Anaerolineaceae bacterium]
METIREQLKNPMATGVAGLVVGLLIGLFVLGWGLWPVKWVDASPAFLRSDLKQDYLRMAIDSYAQNQDKSLAAERWSELGAGAQDVLDTVTGAPQGLKPDAITN